jgi:hypothetical protein
MLGFVEGLKWEPKKGMYIRVIVLLLGVVPADFLADTIAPNPPIILSAIMKKLFLPILRLLALGIPSHVASEFVCMFLAVSYNHSPS